MNRRFTRPQAATAVVAIGLSSIFTFNATQASAAPVDCPIPASDPNLINILGINDFHGRIDDSTVAFAATIEQLRLDSGEDKSIFISGGDNIGASLFASATQDDKPTIDVLNALDMTASALGNHEFDKGAEDARGRVQDLAEFEYLGANVYLAGTTTPAFPEYATTEINGLTVAIIGAVTQETPTLTGGTETVTFGNPVEAVNRVSAQLSDGDPANGEADVIIAEYHEGAPGSEESSTVDEQVAASPIFNSIVNETSAAVDAIFTAHTHMQYTYDGAIPGGSDTRPIVQTGSYGENIGQIMLSVDPATNTVNSYCAQLVPQLETVTEAQAALPRVAEVAAITEAALANAAEVGNEPIGSVTADVTTAFSGGDYTATGNTYSGGKRDDRGSESTLGNLVADSLVSVLADPARGGATIGVVNPGGLRAELFYAGDTSANPENTDGVVTYAEANSVLPFVNNLWTLTLTGEQFIGVLEDQWQVSADGSTPSRAFLKLGLSENVTYTFDPAAPQGSHITSVTIDGQPIDPAAEYRIGTFSFLAQGNDNFHTFTQGTDVQDSGLIDRDAWIDYLSQNSPITPSFAKGAVAVDALPTTVSPGEQLDFNASGFDLTSQGSPLNSGGKVLLNGEQIGTFTIETAADGSRTTNITSTIPATMPAGAATLQLVAAESGTTVTIPLSVLPSATFTVDGTWVVGELANASVTAYPPNTVVTLTLPDGTRVAEFTTDATGAGTVQFAVPAVAAGSYLVTASAAGVSVAATVTILAGATAPVDPPAPVAPGAPAPEMHPDSSLALTGASVQAPLMTAVALLITGAACLVMGRRRG